jgi:hypothetical protein
MPFTPLDPTFVVSCDVYENGPIKLNKNWNNHWFIEINKTGSIIFHDLKIPDAVFYKTNQ